MTQYAMGAAFLCALVSAAGCRGSEPPADPPRLVDVDRAVSDVAVDALVLLGDVLAEKEVALAPDLPERVVTVHVVEGASVRAGDPLVTLDPRLVASDLAQARAAADVARATRDRLQLELDRARRLVATGAAATAQLEGLEAELRGADAQLAQLAAAGQAAGTRRARSVLRAPFDGVVAEVAVEEGDLAAPQVPVARVVAMDRVEVELRVAERDFVRIRAGLAVEVRPPALPSVERPGVVARVSPVLDRRTRTGTVHVAVENADHAIKPGMVAEVALALDRREDVVLVPGPAVVMLPETARTGNAAVFVVDGEVARQRRVALGRRYGDRIEVARGLAAGEPIVVRGQHLLRDGATIRQREAAPATPAAGERT